MFQSASSDPSFFFTDIKLFPKKLNESNIINI